MTDSRLLARWQTITLFTLLIGYAGYYVCRSNLSVAAPAIRAEFGYEKADIGRIVSVGVFCYALGKVCGGILCDFVGGRRMFLFGMFASVGATLLFVESPRAAASWTFPLFLLSWATNRTVQSTGWGALVKLSARWFPVSRHGSVMGVLCLSYLFGDSVARVFLGEVLQWGWRAVFYAAAGLLAAIAVASTCFLKSSPSDVGAEEPAASPQNLFGAQGEQPTPASLADLLAPFLRSPAFWLVCVMSLGLTLIRETFNFWIPTYLVDSTSLDEVQAAKFSALFPFVGGVSSLLAGWLSDRMAGGNRTLIMLPALLLLGAALGALCLLGDETSTALILLAICAVSFFLIGPYTFLTGVMSLDFGGKRGSSTAAGLVDGAGYLGAVLSGEMVGSIADRYGWSPAFGALAAVAVATALSAVGYEWFAARRRAQLAQPG